MTGLTEIQAKALAFIRDFIATKGWSPSLEEIGAELGVNHANAGRLVKRLAERGCVTATPGRARSIRLVEKALTPAAAADPLDFLPDALAVWVRVASARAAVTPATFIAEAVREAYERYRKPHILPVRETSAPGAGAPAGLA